MSQIYIYKNGGRIDETYHGTWYDGGRGRVSSTSERTLYMRLNRNEQMHLQTTGASAEMVDIITCVQYVHV